MVKIFDEFSPEKFKNCARSIFQQKGTMLKLGLQFFAEKKSKYDDVLELAKAFKFINENSKKLTPEEQIVLLTEIENGLSEKSKEKEKEEDFVLS